MGSDKPPQMIAGLLACFSLSFLSCGFLAYAAQCQDNQCALLLDLKRGLIFSPDATKLPNWGSSDNCCGWSGITCDRAGHGCVTGVDLSYETITGWNNTALFDLSSLQTLNLARNSFDSLIPIQIGNLKALNTLNLSNAGFKDQVPGQLSELVELERLDLSANFLSSVSLVINKPNLPELIGNLTRLKELHLDGIDLSHVPHWDEALSSSLPNLQVLSLENCLLSGPIPDSLMNLRSLSHINLNQNKFSSVPRYFGTFSDMKELSMENCELRGEFPQDVFKLQKLEVLSLKSNNNLKISFPEFSENQSLRTLVLSGTVVVSHIPKSFGLLRNMSDVQMAGCSITGSIPPLRMSTKLAHFSVPHNQLSGGIPDEHFQGMNQLVNIDLRNNSLSGSIPSSLFSIGSLQQILLSNNIFMSGIPAIQNPGSSSMNTIDLSGNNLTGGIPFSMFSLPALNVLDLSSNKLNGVVHLDYVAKLRNLTKISLSYNSLTVLASGNYSSLFSQLKIIRLASCNLSVFPLLNGEMLFELDLSHNNIARWDPWIYRANRTLNYLNLSCNGFGDIPNPSLFKALLVLDVHNNHLHGDIPPPPISALYVDYSNNNFASALPSQFGVSAIFFSAANNKLTGNIPMAVCNMTLQLLDLSYNMLSGGIPDCLLQNISLRVLNLEGNSLSGNIPDSFPVNCSLEILALNDNQLEGNVPKSLVRCSKLEVLDLGNNLLNDTFPCAINDSLRVLILRNNSFHGRISCPTDKVKWGKLQIVDLASNSFSGNLSEETMVTWEAMMATNGGQHDRQKFQFLNGVYYEDTIEVNSKGRNVEYKILTVFTSIDFSENKLEGKMPTAIAKFKALYVLNLSHNYFSGSILPEIGNLGQLESLDLSANAFSGIIPQSIIKLNFLSFLNLSHNRLSGAIPAGAQLITFAESSYQNNLGLCGPPLPISCNTSKLAGITGTMRLHWSCIFPGMGIGMGLATVLSPVIFSKTVNKWYGSYVDRIWGVLLPMIGFTYLTKGDWRYEEGDSCDSEGDDVRGDESSGRVLYCIYCTKFDNEMVRVIHDPNCNCYVGPRRFSSSSSCLSSGSE